jgi:hypothetical protein
MARRLAMIRALLGLGLGLWLLAGPAQASIIPVVLHFSDPSSWSGSISFDDTTGQPWTNVPAITAYAIVDMTISDGVHTWTKGELDPTHSLPPDSGLLVDSYGTAAYAAAAIDTDTGAVLSADISGVDDRITETLLKSIVFVDDTVITTTAIYTASVPAPATLLLLTTGVAGLGTLAWRRRR